MLHQWMNTHYQTWLILMERLCKASTDKSSVPLDGANFDEKELESI